MATVNTVFRLAWVALGAIAGSTGFAAPAPRSGVHGKLIVKGKGLEFARAWLIRGSDTGDETKPAAYILLSSRDVGAAIDACKDIRCAIFDVVQEGAILEPIGDPAGSFWLRVVAPGLPHREEQISGRTWTSSLDRHDRLSGKLQFLYANTRDEADLEIDATLAKEFPVKKP